MIRDALITEPKHMACATTVSDDVLIAGGVFRAAQLQHEVSLFPP